MNKHAEPARMSNISARVRWNIIQRQNDASDEGEPLHNNAARGVLEMVPGAGALAPPGLVAAWCLLHRAVRQPPSRG